jgi:membrane protein DedA with SNARE-associated domain
VNAIVQLLVKHGYSVLFVSVFARQMCLPVPAILFLIAAGALAGSGRMTLAVALGLAILACLLADTVWYEAGRRWGNQILHFIYGLALDPDAACRRSKETFVRHGAHTLILAKFVVGLDAATPPLAGVAGTSWSRFIAFDAIGAALWSGVYAGLGYLLGNDLDRAAAYAARLGALWVFFAFAALAIFVGRKLVRWRRFVRESRMARITPEELKRSWTRANRISIADTASRRTPLVEGILIGAWVAELGTTWRNASRDLGGRKLVIDLTNATLISPEGEDALFDLMKKGASFSSSGVLTRSLLKQLVRHKQVSRSACAHQPIRLQRRQRSVAAELFDHGRRSGYGCSLERLLSGVESWRRTILGNFPDRYWPASGGQSGTGVHPPPRYQNQESEVRCRTRNGHC